MDVRSGDDSWTEERSEQAGYRVQLRLKLNLRLHGPLCAFA